MSEPQSFTNFGWFVCVWVLLSAFQYGFHISALNQIQAVMTCKGLSNGSVEQSFGLPTCIPMTDAEFSAVTASFTIGGLLGSIFANSLTDRRGRKAAINVNAGLVAAGSALMTLSGSQFPLLIGRVLIGFGAGIGVCVGPVYLAEIAPKPIKGTVGTLFQLSVVFGILFTQSIGLYLATPQRWRFVLLFSSAFSICQIFVSSAATESPAWLSGNGRKPEAESVEGRLFGKSNVYEPIAVDPESPLARIEHQIDDPLLFEAPGYDDPPVFTARTESISVLQLLRSREMRTPLLIMAYAMIGQQFSGINAVLYYSNNILGRTLPALAAYISLVITIVNAIMTFPAVFLIERMGRKALLFISVGGAFVSLLAVGYGLNSGMKALSSIAIITFVASFAVGLGPIPFVIISDVAPYYAVSALSSSALSINWIANFIVGLVFLPLQNFLKMGNPDNEGRIFYVFAAVLGGFSIALHFVYRPQ